jgi:hypothetical protein
MKLIARSLMPRLCSYHFLLVRTMFSSDQPFDNVDQRISDASSDAEKQEYYEGQLSRQNRVKSPHSPSVPALPLLGNASPLSALGGALAPDALTRSPPVEAAPASLLSASDDSLGSLPPPRQNQSSTSSASASSLTLPPRGVIRQQSAPAPYDAHRLPPLNENDEFSEHSDGGGAAVSTNAAAKRHSLPSSSLSSQTATTLELEREQQANESASAVSLLQRYRQSRAAVKEAIHDTVRTLNGLADATFAVTKVCAVLNKRRTLRLTQTRVENVADGGEITAAHAYTCILSVALLDLENFALEFSDSDDKSFRYTTPAARQICAEINHRIAIHHALEKKRHALRTLSLDMDAKPARSLAALSSPSAASSSSSASSRSLFAPRMSLAMVSATAQLMLNGGSSSSAPSVSPASADSDEAWSSFSGDRDSSRPSLIRTTSDIVSPSSSSDFSSSSARPASVMRSKNSKLAQLTGESDSDRFRGTVERLLLDNSLPEGRARRAFLASFDTLLKDDADAADAAAASAAAASNSAAASASGIGHDDSSVDYTSDPLLAATRRLLDSIASYMIGKRRDELMSVIKVDSASMPLSPNRLYHDASFGRAKTTEATSSSATLQRIPGAEAETFGQRDHERQERQEEQDQQEQRFQQQLQQHQQQRQQAADDAEARMAARVEHALQAIILPPLLQRIHAALTTRRPRLGAEERAVDAAFRRMRNFSQRRVCGCGRISWVGQGQ